MLVYAICYGAGMLFASSAHSYLSGASLLAAALWLFLSDYKKRGKLLDLQAIFSLFFVGGQGLSCLKLSRLQEQWALETWLCFFLAVVSFRTAYWFFEGRGGEQGKESRTGMYRQKCFAAIFILTGVSLLAFLFEAAVLGYIPFFVRGVPHAYSYFHISGVHYVTVSCVLVPSMSVLWLLEKGGEKPGNGQLLAVALASGLALCIPVLCVSRFQLIFAVFLAVLTFMTVSGNQKIRYFVFAAAALIPLYVVLTIARSHDVAYLNGIFEMKYEKMPIFITQPYMYIANNYDNFDCMVKELPAHSLGLKGLFPLWALTGLKFIKPELVSWPLYTTKEELTTVTLFYDAYYDFGVVGVILFGALLGAFAKWLSGREERAANPAWKLFYSQAAMYFMLSFFTAWYSNPTTWFYFAVTGAFGLWCETETGRKEGKFH